MDIVSNGFQKRLNQLQPFVTRAHRIAHLAFNGGIDSFDLPPLTKQTLETGRIHPVATADGWHQIQFGRSRTVKLFIAQQDPIEFTGFGSSRSNSVCNMACHCDSVILA
jgi:hypothetical protein